MRHRRLHRDADAETFENLRGHMRHRRLHSNAADLVAQKPVAAGYVDAQLATKPPKLRVPIPYLPAHGGGGTNVGSQTQKENPGFVWSGQLRTAGKPLTKVGRRNRPHLFRRVSRPPGAAQTKQVQEFFSIWLPTSVPPPCAGRKVPAPDQPILAWHERVARQLAWINAARPEGGVINETHVRRDRASRATPTPHNRATRTRILRAAAST